MAGRHDRAYGRWHSPGAKAGSQRRRRRSRGTYAAKQARPTAPQLGRHDGASKPSNAPAPQRPKGSPNPKPATKPKGEST